MPLSTSLPWILAADKAPYFVEESGAAWTPIGQNDAITWPELAGLYPPARPRSASSATCAWLQGHGVTCLRLMLEYCQREHRYLERPAGALRSRAWCGSGTT